MQVDILVHEGRPLDAEPSPVNFTDLSLSFLVQKSHMSHHPTPLTGGEEPFPVSTHYSLLTPGFDLLRPLWIILSLLCSAVCAARLLLVASLVAANFYLSSLILVSTLPLGFVPF